MIPAFRRAFSATKSTEHGAFLVMRFRSSASSCQWCCGDNAWFVARKRGRCHPQKAGNRRREPPVVATEHADEGGGQQASDDGGVEENSYAECGGHYLYIGDRCAR